MRYLIFKSTDLLDSILLGDRLRYCPVRLTNNDLKSRAFNWLMRFARERGMFFPKILKSLRPFRPLTQVKAGDVVVVFDIADLVFVQYLKRCMPPGVRLYMYFWNPLEKMFMHESMSAVQTLKAWGFELSTFDKKDALQYNILYKPQFIQKLSLDAESPRYDYYFIGAPKGRETQLKEITQVLDSAGLCGLCITPKSPSEFISYRENIRNVMRSRIVIEVVQKGQEGITLRALEALIYGKKLITTCSDISTYDFYSPQNILIWKGKGTDIDAFLLSEFTPPSEAVMQKYDIATWAESFM